ncbi:MAG: amidase [Acidobacteria bacterium]|nr:amidase [Acidobacteriota bacterium]
MQTAMAQGRVTSRELVAQYLDRIARYEGTLNAAMTVNPRALDEARRLDEERRAGRVRGPLHGIPIALKDNIHTTDMPTTGGALAFDGFRPPYDATLVTHLRAAGAVVLAKTVHTELANWVASGMPGNYSALGGYGLNPYDPRPDPRDGWSDGRPALSVGGSSSGIGTAASLWAASVGTETSGSILTPSNATMLVGIKPTVGRISRYGIMPITADQDTAGPMARTVADAAALLGVLEGPSPDPRDPVTAACPRPPGGDYTTLLREDGLRGARIGVPRAHFYEPLVVPGESAPRGGLTEAQAALMAAAIDVLRRQGAEIVDPADVPSVVAPRRDDNILAWDICAGLENRKGADAGCSVVLKYGMKRDFTAYLQTLGAAAPVTSLAALRAFNLANRARNAIRYGQAQLDISDEMDVERDRERYEADRARDLRLAGTQGIDAAIAEHRLDALLFPGSSGAGLAARPGYPSVIVPFGTVPNAPRPPLPADFAARPAPLGVTFTSTACSEPRLIELAYAFEQATKRRVAPELFP